MGETCASRGDPMPWATPRPPRESRTGPVRAEWRRLPPWGRSGLWRIAEGLADADEARRLRIRLEAWRRRCRTQARLAEAMGSVKWSFWSRPDDDGRVRLEGVDLVDEHGAVARVDLSPDASHGTWIVEDQRADPSRERDRLATCGYGWVAYGASDGVSRMRPVSCGSLVCPHCLDARRRRRVERLAPRLQALVEAGCTLVLATRTQRARRPDEQPVELVDGRLTVAAGSATGGEPLADALARLDATERGVRRSGRWVPAPAWTPTQGEPCGAKGPAGTVRVVRVTGPTGHSFPVAEGDGWRKVRARDGWASAVVAEVRGVEATQRAPGGGLRWHVHQHSVCALAGGVDADDWHRWTVARWVEAAGNKPDGKPDAETTGQDTRIVSGDVSKAARQAVKYPGKVAEMTRAGVCEFVAVFKTRKPTQVRGALHGASGIAADAVAASAHPSPIVNRLSQALAQPVAAEAAREAARPRYVGDWWQSRGPMSSPVTRGRAATWRRVPEVLSLRRDDVTFVTVEGLPLMVARGLVGLTAADGCVVDIPQTVLDDFREHVTEAESLRKLPDGPHHTSGGRAGTGLDSSGNVDRGVNRREFDGQFQDLPGRLAQGIGKGIGPGVRRDAPLNQSASQDGHYRGVRLDDDGPVRLRYVGGRLVRCHGVDPNDGRGVRRAFGDDV